MGRMCCCSGSDCGSGEGANAADKRVMASPNMADPPSVSHCRWRLHPHHRRRRRRRRRGRGRTRGGDRDWSGRDGSLRTDLTTDTPTSRRPKGSIEVHLPIYIDRGQIARTLDSELRSVAAISRHPDRRTCLLWYQNWTANVTDKPAQQRHTVMPYQIQVWEP